MKKRTIWITSAAAAAALALGGTAIAYGATDGFEADDDRAGSSQESETTDQLTGADLEKATEAALAEAGAGEVTEAEREDDADAPYEVDVRLDSGKSVEVSLDENFDVIAVQDDDADDANETDGD
ncbi:putative membrane protein YkoI [Agromyces flavus]|uniref:Membrane protein YkoI n=1 Tax=Agromyces flavus TaxID=589382 RepID=A0A1H1ZV01_9MICO|nr:hypothetical protein [Agromyces flavus]MCP2367285.1 putative membrane protein YkoI [Agromyces flavus]GGI46034.1 hypothetical protein GCM10010932_12570 [Agromyces flavus]SDT37510.1 hypothetical protein SAMN04489721_3363 [Agromyces flavus]